MRLWKDRVADSAAAPIATRALSLDSESVLARAFRHRTTVGVDASSVDAVGLWETPLGNAIAVPMLAHGRVVALAYAENPPGHSGDRVQMLETIAEILVGYVNQRLNRHQLAADLQPPSQQANTLSVPTESAHDAVSRQARRVKIDPAVEILVDGVASTLVDLSARGAQIVSPICLRPNRGVRIVLPSGGGSLTCGGRIVWARLDTARAEAPAMYRAGVRFAGVDPLAITTFIAQHRAAEVIG